MMARIGGRHPIAVFVDQMNALARNQGMSRTRFTNPHGLDHAGNAGHSTARDLARLTFYARKHAHFNFLCSQPQRRVSYTRQGQEKAFVIKNTNKLLGRNGVDGVKTGQTRRAGSCLITSVRLPDKIEDMADGRKRRVPYRLVVVVLGSPDRFGQTSQLINQGWGQYQAWLNGGLLVKDAKELLTDPGAR